MERRVRSDLLPQCATSRPRENTGPHQAMLVASISSGSACASICSTSSLILVVSSSSIGTGGPGRQRLSLGRESGRDLSKGNPRGPPKSVEQRTTRPQDPTFKLGSQLVPRNSRHQRTLHCTISLRKPPKPPSGQQIPRLGPCLS